MSIEIEARLEGSLDAQRMDSTPGEELKWNPHVSKQISPGQSAHID
jgi:hypothetical protein